jgi:hypothetical protein
MNDTPDYLHRQLETVHRRIDWHLDRNNRVGFVIACQHRTQLLTRLARLEDTAGEQVPA